MPACTLTTLFKNLIQTLSGSDRPPFTFSSVQPAELIKEMESLNANKASGHDGLPPRLLKMISKEIAPSLCTIFNTSIETAAWRETWKRGTWTPVFKKDDRHDTSNYRPITVLPVVGKIYEKLLSKQITNFMDPILSDNLTAYRKSHSCETTLIRLVEEWKMELDCGKPVGMLSTDMSKAFDSLCSPLLIKKLESYRFSDKALDLVRSYFHNRQNRVKLVSVLSQWRVLKRGCPQGSCFGPLLWNIYQNDLNYYFTDRNISMYADDHQAYVSGITLQNVQNQLQEVGDEITVWYDQNLLQGNFKKYQTITFGSDIKYPDKAINIKIGLEDIEQKDEMKLLGVLIDSDLNFSKHIAQVCRKASQQIGVLSRLKNLVPVPAKLTLFKSAILPHLTYCQKVWHFARASDKRKLERIQERALRVIYLDKTSSYEDLLKRANLDTLNERRLKDILFLMYKVKHQMAPGYFETIVKRNDLKPYSLRNSDFILPRYNTVKYGRHSIRYLGPLLWSKLSSSERNAPTLKDFKRMINCRDISALDNSSCASCYLCNT